MRRFGGLRVDRFLGDIYRSDIFSNAEFDQRDRNKFGRLNSLGHGHGDNFERSEYHNARAVQRVCGIGRRIHS